MRTRSRLSGQHLIRSARIRVGVISAWRVGNVSGIHRLIEGLERVFALPIGSFNVTELPETGLPRGLPVGSRINALRHRLYLRHKRNVSVAGRAFYRGIRHRTRGAACIKRALNVRIIPSRIRPLDRVVVNIGVESQFIKTYGYLTGHSNRPRQRKYSNAVTAKTHTTPTEIRSALLVYTPGALK